MASSSELYNTINDLFEDFQENHRKFEEKGIKAAGAVITGAILAIQYPNLHKPDAHRRTLF